MIEDIRNLSLEVLSHRLVKLGFESYRGRQVFEWLYKKGVSDFDAMKNLPAPLKDKLKSYFFIKNVEVRDIRTSNDLTQKFLFALNDGNLIEGVSIQAKSRCTACLSTQVGCRWACSFCSSGARGFKRDLSVSEILGQLLLIRQNVPERKITNVVFMGVGEPLDNYDNLLAAIRLINDPAGIHLGIRKMTVSTSGLADRIDRLSKEGLELELSVSLHAADDEKRTKLMPVNARYPLKELVQSIAGYIEATKRKVTIEYVLLGGLNTSVEDAQGLIKLLRGLHVKVNLIPFNPSSRSSRFEAPAKLEVLFFKSYLLKHGLDATLRVPRGEDIAAACGQLVWSVDKEQAAKKKSEQGEADER